MSSSRSESIRFQSVLDRLFVFALLFTICLSKRDNADGILRGCSECYKGDAPPNHANSHPSFLTVIFALVGTNEKEASKHIFRICEVEAVLSNIGSILCIVPLKRHCNSICSYRQEPVGTNHRMS